MKSGLLSVTFRKLGVKEIIGLIRQAGLEVVEWGGDIHVPPGDPHIAEEVGKMTRDAGIEVAAYGSYYRLGPGPEQEAAFDQVLQSALKLKAPVIRVWAGRQGSDEVDGKLREEIVQDARRIADLAQKAGIRIDVEYHGKTLTDTTASAVQFFTETNHTNVRSYWQPRTNETVEERLEGIRAIAPWLSNIHVFHWSKSGRLSLTEGADSWKKYLRLFRSLDIDPCLMLEFVKDDRTEQFLQDAEALKTLISDQTQ